MLIFAAGRQRPPRRSADQFHLEQYAVLITILIYNLRLDKLGNANASSYDSFGLSFIVLGELIEEGKVLVGGQLIDFIIAVLLAEALV